MVDELKEEEEGEVKEEEEEEEDNPDQVRYKESSYCHRYLYCPTFKHALYMSHSHM